jgi:hypothetical protein
LRDELISESDGVGDEFSAEFGVVLEFDCFDIFDIAVNGFVARDGGGFLRVGT